MPSVGLMQGANTLNPVASAFEATTDKLNAQRSAQEDAARKDQDRRDNQMLKVFQFAGDGFTEEAKFYAKENGIEVPDAVFQNADFASALGTAGETYPNEPEKAQAFTQTFMSAPGDRIQKYMAARQAAGNPVNPDDREFKNFARKEEYKRKYGAADNAITPYQQAQLDIDRQRLDMDKQKGVKDNFLVVDGIAYKPDAQGNLVASTPKTTEDRGKFIQDVYMRDIESLSPKGEGIINSAGQAYDQIYGGTPQAPAQPAAGTVSSSPARAQTQIPPGLPQGSVMIGTSKGKPVYQDPAGNRYVDDGNP